MLPKDRAKYWYNCVVNNNQTGNSEQRILGLRRIFDNIIVEMYPDISPQAFYYTGIERIFAEKKESGRYKPRHEYIRTEFHKLRDFLNNIQHSKIEASEAGYEITLKRICNFIKYCSGLSFTEEIISIVSSNKTAIIDKSKAYENNIMILPTNNTSILFVINSIDFDKELLSSFQSCINFLKDKCNNVLSDLIVFSLKTDSSKLTSLIEKKHYVFSSQSSSLIDRLKPLSDFCHNRKCCKDNTYVFFISSSEHNIFGSNSIKASDLIISNPKFFKSIGIVLNDTIDQNFSFDYLVKTDKLIDFFNWIVQLIITNSEVCGK